MSQNILLTLLPGIFGIVGVVIGALLQTLIRQRERKSDIKLRSEEDRRSLARSLAKEIFYPLWANLKFVDAGLSAYFDASRAKETYLITFENKSFARVNSESAKREFDKGITRLTSLFIEISAQGTDVYFTERLNSNILSMLQAAQRLTCLPSFSEDCADVNTLRECVHLSLDEIKFLIGFRKEA